MNIFVASETILLENTYLFIRNLSLTIYFLLDIKTFRLGIYHNYNLYVTDLLNVS